MHAALHKKDQSLYLNTCDSNLRIIVENYWEYFSNSFSPSQVFFLGGCTPPWRFFLITQERLRVSTWNFALVTKLYLGTFVQNFRVTWPLVADVSTFCDTWLTKKRAFFCIFKTLITSIILMEKHWNFANLFNISWITFSCNMITLFSHACILQTRNDFLRLFGGFGL